MPRLRRDHETPAPSHLIPRGLAGPNRPPSRQGDTFASKGDVIVPSSLANRVGVRAEVLTPIVEALGLHLLAADLTHGDDTTKPVLAKGETDAGWLWTLVRDGLPLGGADPPATLFRYSRSRSGE